MRTLRDIMAENVSRFWTADLWFARMAVGMASLIWGVLLLSERGRISMRRPVLEALTAVAPLTAWGVSFAICAILQLARVLAGVRETEGGWPTSVVAGFILLLWWMALITIIVTTGLLSPSVVAGNVAITFLATAIFVRTIVRRD